MSRGSRNYITCENFPTFVIIEIAILRKAESIEMRSRSSLPDAFLIKGFLKICSKFTEKHPCRSAISIKLICNFIEITLRHECSPVNLLHIFIKPFTKNTSERLLLCLSFRVCWCLKSEIPNSDKLSNN